MKIKINWLVKSFFLALFFLVILLGIPKPVLAVPIPAGCPGSASPTEPPPGICSTIPAGCPGTTNAGHLAVTRSVHTSLAAEGAVEVKVTVLN